MAVIRSIERHNAHSYAVTDDGQPPVIVGMESIAEHGLEIGRQLTEAHWAAIHRTARHRFAIARALRLIGRRARTRDELCRELSRSFTGPEVESALTRLVELGYLDDQSWAQDYVARSRGRGRSLLSHELSRRGIVREVRERLTPGRARIVENPDFGEGCSSSYQAGIASLDASTAAVVVVLGDQPGVEVESIDLLVSEWRRVGARIMATSYRGERGHPLLFSRELFGELNGLHGDKAAWKVLDRNPGRVHDVPVDRQLPRDVDTWRDYEAVAAERGPRPAGR